MAERKRKMPLPAQVKARKAAQFISQGDTMQQAMVKSGYTDSQSRHHSATILERIRQELSAELERQLPKSKIIEQLIELALGSEKVERILNIKTGEVHEYRDVDPFARAKALELIGKFSGALTRREEVSVEHKIDLANVVAEARRRVKALDAPDVEAKVIRELPAQESAEEETIEAANG